MKLTVPILALALLPFAALAEAPVVDVAVASEDGVRAFNAEEIPTYNIAEDGTLDWPTFSGYRRYHAECHVCHGPDGEGSSYAPALKESALRMDYYDFIGVVAAGRQKVGASDNSVMPAFGVNPNVMCYIDDIYIYLRARGTDAVDRGRPAKRADKSEAFAAAEAACMDG
ncbi:c-type cytochrome, methanol metabolism-related [Frigidibacter albus]|uniref:C-type cytochrome, methanol metabolism-related n=1 Tax=Frigidibacter albus TaxID=1465486 RepID=A0A6L8VES4_9RHOB|nr:c-type cytochrome, methanol metabolism-related [Frigidibacter albus]MZQ88837.1 c-type cytochrome, methanol metabolism-related [Frigidibacter albus]NBE30354.1 c-type cytochrome, methanol metabolism-related [Frigidibacter albus]GGH50780.1 c-type cytochrome, methanol metabolism-related [Frigidibacter albus]